MIKLYIDHPTTNKAAELWGLRAQLNILVEECSETIKAVAKINRAMDAEQDAGKEILKLAEEIGDIFVSTMSVISMTDIEDEVKNAINFKIDRLSQRIIAIEGDNDGRIHSQGHIKGKPHQEMGDS